MLHQNSSHTKNHKTSLLLHKFTKPTTTTAHAAQLPNPHLRYAAFLSKTAHAAISNDFSIKNSSCSPTAKSPPSVCSFSIKNSSCSYFQRLFYQKQLMQPNCQIPTFGMQLFYQKQLMQLFPTTFLSKTAHAAQLPNPHLRYAAFLSKTAHAAISNDFSIKNSSCSPTAKSPPSVCSFSIKNSSCSYFQRLFYQKQLMQPNCQIPTFGMQLFYQKQLMQPNYHAAISNDFSIKNSSCSPTAKSPPSVCSFSIKNSSCSLIIMQLFPTTFLSKTAHAAQLPNPHLRY
jgi:hypothetical protein